MPNPFNTLNPNNPLNVNKMGDMRNIYQVLTHSNNPMQLFQNMARSNPRLQPIMNMLKNGTNPQQLFMSMCQQRGINPQEFIKNLTSM